MTLSRLKTTAIFNRKRATERHLTQLFLFFVVLLLWSARSCRLLIRHAHMFLTETVNRKKQVTWHTKWISLNKKNELYHLKRQIYNLIVIESNGCRIVFFLISRRYCGNLLPFFFQLCQLHELISPLPEGYLLSNVFIFRHILERVCHNFFEGFAPCFWDSCSQACAVKIS